MIRKFIYWAISALVFFLPGSASGQVQSEGKVTSELRYLLYLPSNYEEDDTVEFPLMIFLHGAGERGSDIEKVKVHGPPRLVEEGRQFPFIVVSPQCPDREWWRPGMVIELLNMVEAKYRVDRKQVWLTGLSMGGFGTWDTATRYPELFAAIVPVCGGGDTTRVATLKGIPVWNFHGAKDNVVPLSRSDEMVAALRKAGGDVKYTIYPEAMHDSWTATYDNDELYRWLMTKKK